MSNNRILQKKDGTVKDAVLSKKYIDDGLRKKKTDTSTVLLRSGFLPMTSNYINMAFNKVVNLGDGHLLTDAVNKKQLNNALATKVDAQGLNNYMRRDGPEADANIIMNNNRITRLADPTSSSDAVSKSYVDTGLNNKLDKTISSDVDMRNNKIKNVKFKLRCYS